jgi:hypothetical protein
MSRSVSLAGRFTRLWVARYTRGLDPEARRARCAELESDIYEHVRDARPGMAHAVVLRCLLGMPAELSWRIEQANVGGLVVHLLA